MTAAEQWFTDKIQKLEAERVANPLTGPIPAWRAGYSEDEPIYREVVRDLGEPGQDLRVLSIETGPVADLAEKVQEENEQESELPGMWESADLAGGETDE